MLEMVFYLICVIFAGYATGSIIVQVLKKVHYSYNIRNYLNMILYLITLPFIPILFIFVIMMGFIGVEFIWTLSMGQILL